MEPTVRTKNVKGTEAALRCIIGAILMISGFFIEGILRSVVVVIGVIFIITAIFGY
jgi:hypothetical protein